MIGFYMIRKLKTYSKYYGSDLNKFADLECREKMTVMNIDLIIHRRSRKRIRIIESKHENEKIGTGQEELLRILGMLFKFLNKINFRSYKFDIFLVRGNPPYEEVLVKNLINYNRKKIKKEDLINFLNFDLEM